MSAWAQEKGFPPAEILNDEGGPVLIHGKLSYTNDYLTAGITEPLVILEDQAGFVDRDGSFLISEESQTLGKITSDYYRSPFSCNLTLQERAVTVGHYPTAGLGGVVELFSMPEEESVTFTVGRSLDSNGDIHIEGMGIAPTIDVPVTEETLFSNEDPIIAAAIAYLDEATEEPVEVTSTP